jgi:hypothetical protein
MHVDLLARLESAILVEDDVQLADGDDETSRLLRKSV